MVDSRWRASRPLGSGDLVAQPGLGESQRQLLEFLKRDGESSVTDLESDLDLARETLRDHLKSLVALGLVERSGVRRAGAGRPHVLFRLTGAGESLFPSREGELLRELAVYLLESGQEQVLVDFFEARTGRKRKALMDRVAGLQGLRRLEEVSRILTEEGFVAELEMRESEPHLNLRHCPLKDLVSVSRLPCRAEMAIVGELVGRPMERISFIPDGSHSCTYTLKPEAESTGLSGHRDGSGPF